MNPKITLRPYQQEIVEKVLKSKYKRQLVSMPTGTGKTIVFSEIARRINGKTLILAHRDELILQACEKLKFVWQDADIGVVKSERHETDHQVTVASIQSLHTERLKRMPDHYDLIITDEAHHATAVSYGNAYRKYRLDRKDNQNMPLHVGVTATPNRTDKRLLGDVYDDVTYERDILDFIPEYLSDIRIIRRQSGIVLDGIATSTADLNAHTLSDVLNTPEGNALSVDFWLEVASDRQKTLAFCADIKHIQGLTDMFLSSGIVAAGVHSKMEVDERRGVLKDFSNGNLQVLVNCGILTEGYDCPSIDCILLNRPTKSELLLRQMIGRGTRIFPGKKDCLMLDVACVSNDWDLVSPAKLFGVQPKDEVEQDMKELGIGRIREQYSDVQFSNEVAGIYDTRSPGKLDWRKLRWKGWLLDLADDGKIKVSYQDSSLNSLDIDKYSVEHVPNSKAKRFKVKPGTELKVKDLSLDEVFMLAESYVREHKLDTYFAQEQDWHADLATDKQKSFIRKLGGAKYLTPEFTKGDAMRLIPFLKENKYGKS